MRNEGGEGREVGRNMGGGRKEEVGRRRGGKGDKNNNQF